MADEENVEKEKTGQGAGLKVLVVDDSEAICATIRKILEDEDFEVEVAFAGDLGYQLASIHDYDLITMDLKMPDYSGEEAIMSIDVEKPEAKILVITVVKSDKKRATLREDYPVIKGWIEKPFKRESLIAAVMMAIEKESEPTS